MFLVNKDIPSGCNIKILLPYLTPLRNARGIHRVNLTSPFNLPEQVVHNKNNIPPRADFLNYKPQVKSAIYTQLTLQAVMLIFRFDPRKLEDLWDGDDFVAKWVQIFIDYGMLHKLQFAWAPYFIEMMRLAKLGQVSKQHAFRVLIDQNLVPPPAVGIPPSHKDWHHNCHYQTDSRSFFEYYGGTLESNHELIRDAKNADSNWQSFTMVTDLTGTWILPFVDGFKVKFNFGLATRGGWENKPEEWGKLTHDDLNLVLNRALAKA